MALLHTMQSEPLLKDALKAQGLQKETAYLETL